MTYTRLLRDAFLQAIGVAIYVVGIARLLTAMERVHFFSPMLGFMMLLMLFVLSAAIVGMLVFGRALYMLLTGAKRDGVMLAMMTVGCMAVLTLIYVCSLVCLT